MAQMEAHVETVVIDPDRVPKGGYPLDPLSVAGDRIQCGLDVPSEAIDIEASVLEGERLRVEDESSAHVHGSGLTFDVEERRVQGAQALVECVRHGGMITSKM